MAGINRPNYFGDTKCFNNLVRLDALIRRGGHTLRTLHSLKMVRFVGCAKEYLMQLPLALWNGRFLKRSSV